MAQLPLTVPIAGYRHYSFGRKVLADLAIGAPLQLVREPTNKHDDLAVQVWAADVMLGFVPRRNNIDVAWALDRGVKVTAAFGGVQERDQPVITLSWGDR
jgi:hypothetical protein